MDDLDLDVLLYKIMTDPDLTPSDILGLCGQPGFIFICRLPKVGRVLMNRYYPDVEINENDPWNQFKILASKTRIRYSASVKNSYIDKIKNDENNELFPPLTMKRNYSYSPEYNYYIDVVDVYGVPISGYRIIAGIIDDTISEYNIYNTIDEAIDFLWDELLKTIENDNIPERKNPNYNGTIDYRSPIDYQETYEGFKNDMITKGYSLYHYHRTFTDPSYGDFSDYETSIFSLHEANFI